jgi:hypothetical protein
MLFALRGVTYDNDERDDISHVLSQSPGQPRLLGAASTSGNDHSSLLDLKHEMPYCDGWLRQRSSEDMSNRRIGGSSPSEEGQAD